MNRETKFVHHTSVAPGILRNLRCVCQPDPRFHENIINSIYFDTHDFQLAMEKAASDYLKTKVRLRWYQDPATTAAPSGCYLEIKHKAGSTRQKERQELNLEISRFPGELFRREVLQYIRNTIISLQPDLAVLDLYPQVLVSYTRYRFYDAPSGSRIALDTCINARSGMHRFHAHAGAVHLDTSVLEVKGDVQDLPHCLRAVLGTQVKKDSFSKYYECFRRLNSYCQ